MKGPRVIVHVDLDAFYASVEIRDDPSLRGKPVVVGGSFNRGVVTAASYEARKYGVHSAMPMSRAIRQCPHLIVAKPRMSVYAAESEKFFDVLARYSPLVEGLSLDEAFLDLTGSEALLGPPEEAVRRLREEVRAATRLACSAGIAPVKFVAKIATDVAKPDGQIRIPDDGVVAFLDPLPIGRLWGVGPKRESELKSLGIRTIGDLRRHDTASLQRWVGDEGLHLQALARGEDERGLSPDREAKSMGAEETFAEDIDDTETMETYLLGHAERVASQLRRSGVVAGGVTLKYKLADFKLVTRQTTFTHPTDDGPTLHHAVVKLLHANLPPKPIRLIGLSAHALGPPPPPSLFGPPKSELRQNKLNAALDAIREKHGSKTVTRARLLELDRDRDPDDD